MAVGVSVIGECDVKFITHLDQACHGEGRGTIHADFSIPICRHESKSWIDQIVDDGRLNSIAIDDRLPKMNSSAAQRSIPIFTPEDFISARFTMLPRSDT
jgi:hypothetical protein